MKHEWGWQKSEFYKVMKGTQNRFNVRIKTSPLATGKNGLVNLSPKNKCITQQQHNHSYKRTR